MKFSQPLTNSEQERYAYISGDTASADLFDKLNEYEPENEWDIDSCLDELGLYGVRGDRLYEAVCSIKSKLDSDLFSSVSELSKYKEAFEEMKGFTRVAQVKDLITKIENAN